MSPENGSDPSTNWGHLNIVDTTSNHAHDSTIVADATSVPEGYDTLEDWYIDHLENEQAEQQHLLSHLTDIVAAMNLVAGIPDDAALATCGIDTGRLLVIDPSYLPPDAELIALKYVAMGVAALIETEGGDGFANVTEHPAGILVTGYQGGTVMPLCLVDDDGLIEMIAARGGHDE